MKIHINNKNHLFEFVRLNEEWIRHYFELEATDIALAQHPEKFIDEGGYLFTIELEGQIVGTCALFKLAQENYELARMAVSPAHQGKGLGKQLMNASISKLIEINAKKVTLFSNTKLGPAVALYRSYGFETLFEGEHPEYSRANIIMERLFS